MEHKACSCSSGLAQEQCRDLLHLFYHYSFTVWHLFTSMKFSINVFLKYFDCVVLGVKFPGLSLPLRKTGCGGRPCPHSLCCNYPRHSEPPEEQSCHDCLCISLCSLQLLLFSVIVPCLMKLCPPLAQSSEMPFEELLALYGYEASDPISEQDSESNDIPPNLPDMTLDKVRAAVSLGVCCWAALQLAVLP